MSGVRIIAGTLKGRLIPFDNRKFDDADITPQKVKGAVFSMIGEYLHGKGFLDLFAGSGQIGLEALSRGADPVVFCDSDGRRCHFVKSFIDALGIESRPLVLNQTADRALRLLKSKGMQFDYIFLDPPYARSKERIPDHHEIIGTIVETGILAEGGTIILQHFSGNIMDDAIGGYCLKDTKMYGRTSLSVYSR